jgi:hypothetical protein
MAIRRFSNSSIATGAKSSKLWDGETFPGYFESIATVVVGSSGASEIIFDNIPQNYTHLQIRFTARSTRDYNGNSGDVIAVQINSGNINTTNAHWLYGNGSSALAATNNPYIALITDVSGGAAYTHPSNFGSGIIDIIDYSNSNKNKTVKALSGFDTNGGPTNGDLGAILLASSFYNTTASISRLRITCLVNFMQHSNFALYGIRSI